MFSRRWPFIAMLALALFALALSRWEWQMRTLGLRATDIDDGESSWAVERRKVDAHPHDAVVLIGDSRNLIDNNLDVWQQVTGIRPLQLSIPGSSPLPILQDLADDTTFTGMVLLGGAEINLVAVVEADGGNMAIAQAAAARAYSRAQSPTQRTNQQLQLWLSQRLALLDSSYALFNLLGDLPLSDRAGVQRQSLSGGGAWKLAETHADRQTRLWRRLECDRNLQLAFRNAWSSRRSQPISDASVSAGIAQLRPAIDKIRQRGGEVVLLRPPSAARLRELEQGVAPRARVWNRLVRETGSFGINFEDYEDMQDLDLPEWSHLSGSSARLFTQSYVSVLCRQVNWLKARSLPTCGGAPSL
jgi:hypothetical protein